MRLRALAERPTLVVGGSLLLLLMVVLYWTLHFWFLRQGFVGEIQAIEPRTSRLLGIMASADQLSAAADTARGRLQELAYPADRDSATTAAAMQQNIRELLTGAGLSISGSQILQQRTSTQFDRLRLDITAEGNIEDLDDALTSLESMRPLVLVEVLKITPQRTRTRARGRNPQVSVAAGEDPRRLVAQFQLFSLRLKD